MSIKSRLDDVREWVQPGYKLRRQQLTQLQEISEKSHRRLMENHFEGAEKDRHRGDAWLGSRLSPDSAAELDLEEMRERSDELYRNFGFVTGAIDHRTDNVIGKGLRPKAAIVEVEGLISKEDAARWNKQLDEAWAIWQLKAGRSGRQTFAEASRLAYRERLRGGDSLIVFSDTEVEGKPIPLQVNVVAGRRIETPPKKISDADIRLGVQKNDDDDPEGYWVRESQPFDTKDTSERYEFFEAERASHIFEEKWEGQTRGIPWVAPIINECKDFKDFREATIIKQQTEACVMMIIATADPKKMAEAARNAQGQQEMSPGRILYTNIDETMTPFTPGQGGGENFDAVSSQMLLGMACGLNQPYGWLVRDRRKSTLASGKLEEVDGNIMLQVEFQLVHDRVIQPTWERFVRQCVMFGIVDIPIALFRKFRPAFLRFNCARVGRGWIDMLKEVTAAVLAKNENIMSLEQIGAGLGLDNDETMIRRSVERKTEREKDIEPPSLKVVEVAPKNTTDRSADDDDERGASDGAD